MYIFGMCTYSPRRAKKIIMRFNIVFAWYITACEKCNPVTVSSRHQLFLFFIPHHHHYHHHLLDHKSNSVTMCSSWHNHDFMMPMHSKVPLPVVLPVASVHVICIWYTLVFLPASDWIVVYVWFASVIPHIILSIGHVSWKYYHGQKERPNQELDAQSFKVFGSSHNKCHTSNPLKAQLSH